MSPRTIPSFLTLEPSSRAENDSPEWHQEFLPPSRAFPLFGSLPAGDIGTAWLGGCPLCSGRDGVGVAGKDIPLCYFVTNRFPCTVGRDVPGCSLGQGWRRAAGRALCTGTARAAGEQEKRWQQIGPLSRCQPGHTGGGSQGLASPTLHIQQFPAVLSYVLSAEGRGSEGTWPRWGHGGTHGGSFPAGTTP